MASAVPIKVLLVEDEMLLVMSLRLALECDERFVVTGHAARMVAALQSVERQQPDIALVDIRLANGESGIDAARALRQRAISSLLMSGDPPDAPLPEVAVGCLAKPFGDHELTEALAIAVSPSREAATAARPPASLTLY